MITNFFLDNRIGGPHNYILNINKLIPKKNIQYITCGTSNISKINLKNFRYYLKFLFIFEIIFNFFEILYLNKQKKITNKIFFVHGINNYAPVLAGCFLNKKIYWSIVETPSSINKKIFKVLKFFINFDIILISKKIAENLNIQEKYYYLPPYIDLKFWKKNKKEINNRKSQNKIVNLLCVGNINKEKGYHILIDNLAKVNFDIELKIVGLKLNTQKKYYNNLVKKIDFYKKNNKKFNVKLLGWKNKKDLKKLYKNCDAFLLSSLQEGCPIVVLEAMSMECFCIVSNVGNISSFIKNMKSGLIFDHNKNNFLSRLNQFKSMKNKNKEKIRKSARKNIFKIFNNKEIYKSFYNKILLN